MRFRPLRYLSRTTASTVSESKPSGPDVETVAETVALPPSNGPVKLLASTSHSSRRAGARRLRLHEPLGDLRILSVALRHGHLDLEGVKGIAVDAPSRW